MSEDVQMWWNCPHCGARVNFENQVFNELFNFETGEAAFVVDPEVGGVYIHTIECDTCTAYWLMSISPMLMRPVE